MAKKKTKKKNPTLAMVCTREGRVVLAFDARGREVVLSPTEALILARSLTTYAGLCNPLLTLTTQET